MTDTVAENRKFQTLDGIRGMAALCIVFRHAMPLITATPYLGSTYLAVDIFFVLSGFVIAHAYDRRFAAGLGVWAFMWIRLRRLWPLYLLGLGISVGTTILAKVAGISHQWSWPLIGLAGLTGALYVPMPPITARGDALFPFNAPSWSLFFELFINLAFAALWRLLTARALIVVVALFGLVLLGSDLILGSINVGWNAPTFLAGFPRVIFSFLLGVALHRFRNRITGLSASPWLMIAAVFGLLWYAPPEAFRTLYDGVCVVLIFPAIVALGASTEPGIASGKVLGFAGLISYALYAIHAPLIGLAEVGIPKLLHRTAAHPIPALGVTIVGVTILAAWAADEWFDSPLRRFWQRRRGSPVVPPATP